MQSAAFRPKRLFPQPGGFEGLVPIEVALDPHDLSVAHRDDECLLEFRLYPAGPAPTTLATW
jgi:hypothetical protein